MESNEQTESTSEIETESLIESRLTAMGEGGGIEYKRKRTHGHGQCGAKGEGGYKGEGWVGGKWPPVE